MKHAKIGAIILVAVILVASVTALAAQGGAEDPLITLSYLTQVLTPKLEGEVDKAVAANEKAMTERMNAAIAAFEKKLDQQGGGSSVFSTVALAKGEGKTGPSGGEYLLRSGSAAAVGQLLDTTAGTSLAPGGALVANHLYVALEQDGGVKATAAASVMVRQ